MTKNKFNTLYFKGYPIRSIETDGGSIVCLSLADICRVLNRVELVSNGKAVRLCRSSYRTSFREGGRNTWAVKPYDICYLLKAVKDENIMIKETCASLEKWINELPMAVKEQPLIAIPIPQDPVIFNYQERFPITFKTEAGKTKINATQMGCSFGKNPTAWLRLAATIDYRESLVAAGVSESLESQVLTARGKFGVTWIDDCLAMEYARWLSPEFSIWCNQCIRELTDNGSISPLKASKKYNPQIEFPVPKTFEEALLLAAGQARKISEDEHKVVFYEEFVENRNWFKTTRLADELEITARQLNRFLLEEEIIRLEKNQWIVLAPYRALQSDIPYMYTRKNGKTYPFGGHKRWNQAGRDFILELWYKRNPKLEIFQS